MSCYQIGYLSFSRLISVVFMFIYIRTRFKYQSAMTNVKINRCTVRSLNTISGKEQISQFRCRLISWCGHKAAIEQPARAASTGTTTMDGAQKRPGAHDGRWTWHHDSGCRNKAPQLYESGRTASIDPRHECHSVITPFMSLATSTVIATTMHFLLENVTLHSQIIYQITLFPI